MSQSTISFILDKVLKFDLLQDRISKLENKSSTLEEIVNHLKSQNAEFVEKFEILKNEFEDLSKSQKDSCIIIQELPNFESKSCQLESAHLEESEIDDLEKPGKSPEILKSNDEISQNVEEIEEKSTSSKPVVDEDVTEKVKKNIASSSDFILELSQVIQNLRSPKSQKNLEKSQSIVENSNDNTRNEETNQSQDLHFKMSLLENFKIVLHRIDGEDPLKKSFGKDDSKLIEEKPAISNENAKLFNIENNCQICEIFFGSYSEMSIHMRGHIGERVVKSVNVCKKIYTCTICSKQCFRKGDLIKHHNRIHANGQKLHKCKICSKTFNQKYSLDIHKRIHKTTLNFKSCEKLVKNCGNSQENVQLKSNLPDEKSYKCPACPKILKSLDSLNVHYKSHIKILQDKKEFKCLICSKSFARKVNLENHIRIHTREKPFKCKVCSKSFTQIGHLLKHKKASHTENVNKISQKKSLSKFELKVDDKNILDFSKSKIKAKNDPGEERHSCLVCSKKFSSKKKLANHNLIHTKKFYFCPICKKNFTQKIFLTRHITRIHGTTTTTTTPTYNSDNC